MARERPGYVMGDDAAYIKPRLIPDYQLMARDDSGGMEWDAYTQEFGDGGFVTGQKKHLSVSGAEDDDLVQDEIDAGARWKSWDKKQGLPSQNADKEQASAKTRKLIKE